MASNKAGCSHDAQAASGKFILKWKQEVLKIQKVDSLIADTKVFKMQQIPEDKMKSSFEAFRYTSFLFTLELSS